MIIGFAKFEGGGDIILALLVSVSHTWCQRGSLVFSLKVSCHLWVRASFVLGLFSLCQSCVLK